MKTKIP